MSTVTIIINNKTDLLFTWTANDLIHGEWLSFAPSHLQPQSTSAPFIAASSGAGIQGWIHYKAGSGSAETVFQINFDNPVVGNNGYSISATPAKEYVCTWKETTPGVNAGVTFTIEYASSQPA